MNSDTRSQNHSCSSCGRDDSAREEGDLGHTHAHNHEHSFELDLKLEVLTLAAVTLLLTLGLIYQEALHNTPFFFGEYIVFLTAYLLSGWNVLYAAIRNLYRGIVFDENFLMAVATLGAIAIHQLPEAVAVMLFFKLGELLQGTAVSRSRRSIRALLDVQPSFANLERADGTSQRVAPNTVRVGDIVTIRPGEKIPLDGDILRGHSRVDTSALTGESIPRSVRAGDAVLAGMLNQSGAIAIRVTKPYSDSSITKMMDLVERAGSRKAPTEQFISRFARWYTPAVVAIAVATAVLPPLLWPGAEFSQWVYRALVMLVISCPCGLVISIPLGYFGGVGGAARRGILVKGSAFLDVLAAVKVVVFDKTGTLTEGTFEVSQIVPQGDLTEAELLELAARIEAQSNHPVAASIRAAYGQPLSANGLGSYREIAGYGVRAKLQGQEVLAGSDRLLHLENIDRDVCNVGGTAVHIAIDRVYAGYIAIDDRIKSDAAEAIRALKSMGVERVVLLSGDRRSVAERVAKALGIDEVVADLLPEGKLAALEQILARDLGPAKVAMVGDGINDAPALARADVGLAMGGLGSDAAIETADVTILTDSPRKVAEAIAIGRKTLRIVWQNIAFALGVKVIFVLLGAIGIATLWEAVFADVGVALLAILNATRVLR
ncbi:heavy metal translocating P-type ATPase [Synechococcus sp. PCC 7336]|uniref:heavy metal translocating P-type ATPase n=1 Tax=Synechococcus sp. PCC 7336 TaxID=195250 RepID=UPI00034DC3F9|nr:heavy metal translocating P-type ATPase [Synechococcus sp. PCC 7336]